MSNAITSRRRAECKWLLDKNNLDKFLEFYRSRHLTTNILNQAEKNYFHKPVHDNQTKTKKIFTICNNLLGRNQDLPLPPGFTDKELAKCLNNFFISKIANIKDSLTAKQVQLQPPPVLHQSVVTCMDSFRLLSDDEVSGIVRKTPTKTCQADPIPTTPLKEILPKIVPLLREIVNKSLQTGTFPDNLKVALVRPLLKKINLDLIEKNYRPVSNLQFIGKLIERAVNIQLNEHITTSDLMEPMQSAYRVGHNTETALIKVKADILNAIDNKEVVCLVLLDLSTAFDTVDHKILLERLKNMFGLTGTVINWITSYLSGRFQKVVVGDANSSAVPLSCVVPQESILGPILFMLYTTPLRKICKKHAVTYHLYADDQQLYLAFKPSNAGAKEQCIKQLQGCIADIHKWMSANMLKLNNEKTEFIMFGTNHQLKKTESVSTRIAISNTNVLSVDHVCNLGFLMDNTLKNQFQINKLTSSTFNQLMNIRRICSKLDWDTTKYINQALVISKLDYCNSLLLRLADYQLNKIQ